MSAFSHRRARADSTASFTYYEEPELPEDGQEPETFADLNESFVRRSISDLGDLEFGIDDEEDSADREYLATHDLTRTQPWAAEGISRRTWERRRKAKMTVTQVGCNKD